MCSLFQICCCFNKLKKVKTLRCKTSWLFYPLFLYSILPCAVILVVLLLMLSAMVVVLCLWSIWWALYSSCLLTMEARPSPSGWDEQSSGGASRLHHHCQHKSNSAFPNFKIQGDQNVVLKTTTTSKLSKPFPFLPLQILFWLQAPPCWSNQQTITQT